MTEKNSFACKLFLSLYVSDFNFFYVKIATPPPLPPSLLKEVTTLSPSNPPLKVEVLSRPPPPSFFFENLVGGLTPQPFFIWVLKKSNYEYCIFI